MSAAAPVPADAVPVDPAPGGAIPVAPPGPAAPDGPPVAAAARPRGRRARRWLGLAAVAGVVALMVVAWPVSLGGRASYVIVNGHSMDPTFHLGDLAVGWPTGSYHRGEVVMFRIAKGRTGAGQVVIHRIVGGDARHGFLTKGDNNHYLDPWRTRPADILGRQRMLVPQLGPVVEWVRAPIVVALLFGLLAAWVMLGRRAETETEPASEAGAAPAAGDGGDDRADRAGSAPGAVADGAVPAGTLPEPA